MQWFEIKERSAGKKRLILTYYIYRLFGKWGLYSIAFFVSFFTFLFSPDLRLYSKKFFKVILIKPSLWNEFRHVLSYAISLADKIIVYLGKFDTKNIVFENENIKKQLFCDIREKNGVCFIFSHIGNIEVLQSFFQNQKEFPNLNVNIFMNRNQTKVFNEFLNTIKKPIPADFIVTEDFDITDVIKLKEKLDKGGVLFIAGDRQMSKSASVTKNMFSCNITLPYGTFRLAKLLDVPVYFIGALKEGNIYKVFLDKNIGEDIITNYIKFMEKITKKYPMQFYHFYDFFNVDE